MTQAALPGRLHGEVFTKRWVAETILDLVGYTPDRDLGALTIVEPSIGSGAFLIPMVERLIASSNAHGRAIDSLADALRGYDIQSSNIKSCAETLGELGIPIALADKWLRCQDFLLDDDWVAADFVVGNPPYIRLEDLDSDVSSEYRRRWSAMGGRADIYVGFYERGLSLLRPNGALGFICADRWMRNQYGAGLRHVVAGAYSVEHVWSMHDVEAFEEQVSAYPAITVIRNTRQRQATVVDTTSKFGESNALAIRQWASGAEQAESLAAASFSAHRLPTWFLAKEPWPTGSPGRLALIEKLNRELAPLHDDFTGTRIGIGVATGNDGVYVTSDPTVVEPDRLLKLSMSADLKTGEFQWGERYLVNPWERGGRLVQLGDYPKLAAYFSSAAGLRDRHVAKKAPHNWYRTIDKVNSHSLTNRSCCYRTCGPRSNQFSNLAGTILTTISTMSFQTPGTLKCWVDCYFRGLRRLSSRPTAFACAEAR